MLSNAAPYANAFAVATNQTEWAAVLQKIPPGSVPQAYQSPDFSQQRILFVHGTGDQDPQAFIRLLNLAWGRDGVNVAAVEFCGNSNTIIATHKPYAIYAFALGGGTFRRAEASREPPNCSTTR
jgi:hypothetical protein